MHTHTEENYAAVYGTWERGILYTIWLDKIRVIEKGGGRESDGVRRSGREMATGERDGEKRIAGGREEKNSKSSFV